MTPPSGSAQMFGFYRQTEEIKSICLSALGRWCNVNVVVPKPDVDFTAQDSSVLAALKTLASHIVKPYSAADVPETVRANVGVGKI